MFLPPLVRARLWLCAGLWLCLIAACSAQARAGDPAPAVGLAGGPAAGVPAAGAVFPAADSLAVGTEPRADARACLAGLCWEPGSFDVTLAERGGGDGDLRVRFPSPCVDGPDCTDTVWMEWYQARDTDGHVTRGPACVVVHESGSGMTVGRIVARSLAAHGIHAFMVQMPFYGARRPTTGRVGAEMIVTAGRQAVADVRRARDAAAVLPLVDAARISLQGTSLGGFVAATVAGLDGGYDNVFILLAGGDLAGVLARGKRDAAKVRERLVESGMTAEQIGAAMHAIEPTRLAHRYRPDRTWIFSARHDDVVPPAHCTLLAESGGLPDDHHVQLEADHYTGIIYLPVVMARIAAEIHGTAERAPPAP
jgi:dienelactone hydrolase